MQNIKKTERLFEIDFLRGIAIILMIIFHFFYLLDYFQIQPFNMHDGVFLIFARTAEIIFLTLVGISLYISHTKTLQDNKPLLNFYKKHLYRGFIVLMYGFLITLITKIFIPDNYVLFGILHLIGLSIIILSPLVEFPKLQLIVTLLIFFLSPIITSIQSSISFLLIFGVKVLDNTLPLSIDYFPIFPWVGFITLGMLIGKLIYKNNLKPVFHINALIKQLQIHWLGKHSLVIYLLHIPILMLTIKIIDALMSY